MSFCFLLATNPNAPVEAKEAETTDEMAATLLFSSFSTPV